MVYCHVCRLADRNKKLYSVLLKEEAFIHTGFCNWKDATARFRNHEKTKIAVDIMITLPRTTRSIGEILSKEYAGEVKHSQKMLLTILKAVQFLSRQGLALRGDNNETNSNFSQTLNLLDVDGSLRQWMERKQNKYTSPMIQNEILQLLALSILRDVASNIQNKFFTIMCDECTDSSNKEQLVICLRWVDEDLSVHEDFIGLYVIPNISAAMIFSVVKDTLMRLNIGLCRCRGQCYDGASNMSGHRSGIAKQITDLESRALYTHCYGHSLNLAVGDTVKSIKALRDIMDITYEISGLIKLSPKRNNKFDCIKEGLISRYSWISSIMPYSLDCKSEQFEECFGQLCCPANSVG